MVLTKSLNGAFEGGRVSKRVFYKNKASFYLSLYCCDQVLDGDRDIAHDLLLLPRAGAPQILGLAVQLIEQRAEPEASSSRQLIHIVGATGVEATHFI